MIKGVLLVGCGKMGTTMLNGWRKAGIAKQYYIVEPDERHHSLLDKDCLYVTDYDALGADIDVTIIVFALKPQVMANALGVYGDLIKRCAARVLSIAAGKPIAFFADFFGHDCPIMRCMPNTPSAVGAGITAICGNDACTRNDLDMAYDLLHGVGEVVFLDTEEQMDAVTGLSGSGPAYVFYMIDCMCDAGIKAGLGQDLSMKLALHTVFGASKLALESSETAEQLRINVTSPGGTTKAGLDQLMDEKSGLHSLMERTILAAGARSKELGS